MRRACLLTLLALGGLASPAAAQTEGEPEPPAPTALPDLVLSGRDVRMSRVGVVGVRLGCRPVGQMTGEACLGTLELRLAWRVDVQERRGGRTRTRRLNPYVLGRKSFSTPAGNAALLKLKLDLRTQRFVRQLGRFPVQLIGTYNSRAGAQGSAKRKIWVYFPRRSPSP